MEYFDIGAELEDLANKSSACVYTKGPQMVRKCTLESELDKFTTLFPKVKTHLEMTFVQMQSVLKQWNCGWDPNCNFQIAAHTIFSRKMKAECEFCPGEFEQNAFAAAMYKEGTNVYDYGIMEWKVKGMLEQAEADYSQKSAIWGVYNPLANASGVPGTPYNVMDGLFAQTQNHITNGDFVPTPTGQFTVDTVWEQLKMMKRSMFAGKKYAGNLLLISCEVYEMVIEHFEKCGKNVINFYDRFGKKRVNEPIWVPNSGIQLCPLTSFGNSHAAIMTSKSNLLRILDLESDARNLWTQKDKWSICLGHARKGGIGFMCPDPKLVVVNDQIPTIDQLGTNAPSNFEIPAEVLTPLAA